MSRLYVGNLNSSFTKQKLADTFIRYGPLVDVWFNADKCYGFIEFENPGDAREAIQHLDKTRVQGLELKVELTKYRKSQFAGVHDEGQDEKDDHINIPSRFSDQSIPLRSTRGYRESSYSPQRRSPLPPPSRNSFRARSPAPLHHRPRGYTPPRSSDNTRPFPPRGQPSTPRGRHSPPRGQPFPSRGRHSPPRGQPSTPRGQPFPSRGRHSPPRGQPFISRGRSYRDQSSRNGPRNGPSNSRYSPEPIRDNGINLKVNEPRTTSDSEFDSSKPLTIRTNPPEPTKFDLSKPLTISSNRPKAPPPQIPNARFYKPTPPAPPARAPAAPPARPRSPPRTRYSDYREQHPPSRRFSNPPPLRGPGGFRNGNRHPPSSSPPRKMFRDRSRTPPIRYTDYRENRRGLGDRLGDRLGPRRRF